MMIDDPLEKYLVLDPLYPVSLNQFFEFQLTEIQMLKIKQLCKITSVINDDDAIEILMKQQSLKNSLDGEIKNLNYTFGFQLSFFYKNNLVSHKQYHLKYFQPNHIWDQVGLYILKSPYQLQKKWQEYTLNSVNLFKPWTTEEDSVVRQLVSKKMPWSKIGDEFNEQFHEVLRTGKKCRDRWLNFLDPSIQKKNGTIKTQKSYINL
ncbi:hypothetical protein pb186bvf_009734 [Paramecium bursaria]